MYESFEEASAFFEHRKKVGIKPGLGRIQSLLKRLGSPQENIKGIHVAGTNGKGSTAHFLEQAFLSNGYRTGVFTSPSHSGITGHILVDGKPVSQKKFIRLCNRVLPIVNEMDEQGDAPTEFEIITAIAFLHFSSTTDIAVIEAGMGGREDTTNCFHPLVSIITNVAKDHIKFLGDTEEKIAYHKAGVIKPKTPAIIGWMPEKAADVIRGEAKINESEIFMLGQDFNIIQTGEGKMQLQNLTGIEKKPVDLELIMKGKHQMANASLAWMALSVIKRKGFPLNEKHTIRAIEQAKLPCRFEMVRRDPTIIVDGAHNPAGMTQFLETVHNHYKERDKHLVFAAFKDKDVKGMLHRAAQYFDSITVTSFDHPRAATASELEGMVAGLRVSVVDQWQSMMGEMVADRDTCYFIAGSLHFIAEVRQILME
ncbi:bifunctional folylpolyglutamate synthase/dihydrofolate synthase [Virgibacillus xinjiangensis]|uniref:tetrahydrofolate synthase n=1 Tax=Virgibacillus xinjiangensis TaxID=393090 RepID=A0ABV7CUI2_9BACI